VQSLSKAVAAAGAASRRKAVELIRAGRVRIDGEVVTNPALPVDPAVARIAVDGRPLEFEPRVCILLHKPRGPLSTVFDERGRQTVIDLLGDVKQRLYPAGRLDADTEGLLVITNDGDLTLQLTHPRYGIEKVYEAEVQGHFQEQARRRLEEGMMLEDGHSGPARVRVLRAAPNRSRVEIALHSGRKRQVRRMLEAVGHPVVSLVRTRVGPLGIKGLGPGQWRTLTTREIERLRAQLAKPSPRSSAEASRPSEENRAPQRRDKQLPTRRAGGAKGAERTRGSASGRRVRRRG